MPKMNAKEYMQEFKSAIESFEKNVATTIETNDMDESDYKKYKDDLLEIIKSLSQAEKTNYLLENKKFKRHINNARRIAENLTGSNFTFIPYLCGKKSESFFETVVLKQIEKIKEIKLPILLVPFSEKIILHSEEIAQGIKTRLEKSPSKRPTVVRSTLYNSYSPRRATPLKVEVKPGSDGEFFASRTQSPK